MSKILMINPPNIYKPITEMVEEFKRKIEEKYEENIEILSYTASRQNEFFLQLERKESEIPDIILGFALDFAKLGKDKLHELFQPFPEEILFSRELAMKGFINQLNYLQPIYIVPYVIIYNKKLLSEEEIPVGWNNLLNDKWKGKIIVPDQSHSAFQVVQAYMKYLYPENYQHFLNNVVTDGTGIDVKNSVDEGKYPIGITSVSFSKFARHKNIGVIWPEEGATCTPSTIGITKEMTPMKQEFIRFLLSHPVQTFFAKQGFIPVNQNIELPSEAENQHQLIWWDSKYFFNL